MSDELSWRNEQAEQCAANQQFKDAIKIYSSWLLAVSAPQDKVRVLHRLLQLKIEDKHIHGENGACHIAALILAIFAENIPTNPFTDHNKAASQIRNLPLLDSVAMAFKRSWLPLHEIPALKAAGQENQRILLGVLHFGKRNECGLSLDLSLPRSYYANLLTSMESDASPADVDNIEHLIHSLDDRDVNVRTHAKNRLLDIGNLAVEQLITSIQDIKNVGMSQDIDKGMTQLRRRVEVIGHMRHEKCVNELISAYCNSYGGAESLRQQYAMLSNVGPSRFQIDLFEERLKDSEVIMKLSLNYMLDMQDFSRPIVERWVRQGSEPGRTILRNVLIAMDRKKAKANKKWWQFWIQRAR